MIKAITRVCPICSATKASGIGFPYANRHNDRLFNYMRCASCTSIFVDPVPGQIGDAHHAVLCAAVYNLRWLLRAMVRLGLKALLFRTIFLAILAAILRANAFHRLHPAAKLSFGMTAGSVR